MRKNIILFGILIALSLSGCGDKGTEMLSSTDVTEENSNLPDGENQEETVSSESVDDRNVDLTDYSSYLKKIWIIEWWEFGGEAGPISLVITKIEDGNIEGYFKIEDYLHNYYFGSSRTLDNLPVFYGTIYDGTAECKYDYKDGREGKLVIAFCENNRLEVRLDENEDQCYLLKPYNVSDVKFCNESMFFEVELDSWGMITLFYANDDEDRSMPQVFLLNQEGDILYEFSTSYLTNSEVLEIIVEDMNEDGLKDIEVVTYLPFAPDAYRAEWYFYQLEDGLFYKDWNNIVVLEDGEFEVSIHGNELFHLLFYGCFPIKPNICQVRENLLEVSISVGSPACYTFYIDKEDAKVSDTYFNPILVGEEYVAYMEDNGELILCDIFYSDQQENLLYMTIVRDFTKTADPMSAIMSIELIDSGNVKLTYLTGNDYTEVTEIISLEKDIKPEQSAAADSSSELIVSNPYFYNREKVFLQAKAKYFDGRFQGSRAENAVYIDVEMLQTYENGSVYKFTVDIDEDDVYFDEGWLYYYFYVTEDKIYEVPSSINIPSEGLVFHFNEDISSLPEMFDTDEKLVEWSTIVCQEDEMIEDQESYYQRITRTGNQITYYSNSLKANGDVYRSLYYTWEEGRGLISCGFRDGVGEGYDFTLYDIEELTVAGE